MVPDPRRYQTDEREQGKACSGTCRSAQHITASVPKSALPAPLLKHHWIQWLEVTMAARESRVGPKHLDRAGGWVG